MKKRRNERNIHILVDKTYLKDRQDEAELEKKYMELELSPRQRMIINDYIACIRTANSRYCYLYSASIVNTIRRLKGKESYI